MTATPLQSRRARLRPSALALGDVSRADEPGELDREQQIGLDDPFKVWCFKFDAVGVAYRFSDRSDGIRII